MLALLKFFYCLQYTHFNIRYIPRYATLEKRCVIGLGLFRSTVALGIRKVQYAPSKPGPQPCTVVRKDFVLSPGQLELELTLDKQVAALVTAHSLL